MIKDKFLKNECGFAFLEVMIALSILAITMLPLMNLFHTSVKYTLNTHDIQAAMRFAEDEIEKYSACSFAELRSVLNAQAQTPLLPEPGTSQTEVITTQLSIDETKYDINKEFQKFKRKATLSKVDGSEDMLLIEVNVWWYDGGFASRANDQRFVTLSTIIHRDMVL